MAKKKTSVYPVVSVQVFDRLGKLVYKKEHYKNDWNGRNNQQKIGLVPNGIYFYMIENKQDSTKNDRGMVNGEILKIYLPFF